jgi:hypothetical protein
MQLLLFFACIISKYKLQPKKYCEISEVVLKRNQNTPT